MGGRAAAAAGGALLAALALLGSGCSAGSASGSKSADSAVGRSAGGGAAKADIGAGSAAPATAPSAAPGTAGGATDGRSIAYTAELELQAKDVASALEQLRGVTTAAGGYVSSETVQGGDTTTGDTSVKVPQDGSHVVVKVPSAAFDRTLSRFAQLGKVVQQHREAEDVTDKVVDVTSRLKTQRASVDRVRALMDKAEKISDVVALEGELSRREADLESLERQQEELAAQTSLSTITVDLYTVAPPVAAAKAPRGFGSAVGHALAGGWHALYATARGLLVGLAAIAPFALVLVPAGWLAVRLWRRRRDPQPALTAPVGEPDGEPDGD
ncbi:DUF4349 domain-containing protein [Peterkaempfera sp. SMS 1(5)a]|uniref:DUF4349 domain-containing protein n=1 Tax=Peterkaempfera podocarpi TaxID=3232308 RepID=UPI00366C1936